jgi:hypothetical protein
MKAMGVDAIKVTYSDQTHTGSAPLPVLRSDRTTLAPDTAWCAGNANELRDACWNHVFFDDLMPSLVG